MFSNALYSTDLVFIKKEEKKGPILKVRLTPIEVPPPQLLNHKLVCIVF